MAKQRANLKTMDAKEQLYGFRLTRSRVIRIILGYEIGVFLFAYILYGPNNPWWIVGWMALAALYIYKKMLPRKIEADYQRRAEVQRNRFINIVTQGMTTKHANIVAVLRRASTKADGEFKRDLMALIAVIMSADNYKELHAAFVKLQKKYEYDIYFTLFMEQVETVVHESIYHIETFKTFKNSSNTILMKEKEFIQKKKQVQKNMIVMAGISCFTNAICLMMPGYQKYLTVYADTMGGIIVSTVYLVAIATIINGFYKRFYDDNVTHF